jgi:hypothetical protein
MSASEVKKSYKGYIMNAKGTAHFFATGENTCLCGDMTITRFDKRSRTVPVGAIRTAKKCERKRRSRGL